MIRQKSRRFAEKLTFPDQISARIRIDAGDTKDSAAMSDVMQDHPALRLNGKLETAAYTDLDFNLAKRGDNEAFARLYDCNAAVVLSLCRSRLHPSEISEAEDACQETFIRAFNKFNQVTSSATLRPWLYGIARNVCSERKRANVRRNKHEANAMVMNNHQNSSISTPAEETSQHVEELDYLTDAISQLPERERLAIHLYYLDPDPVAAACEALNISRSGFYKLLKRARKQLAALMKQPQQS